MHPFTVAEGTTLRCEKFSLWQDWSRIATVRMYDHIPSVPDLRAQMTPDYPLDAKRYYCRTISSPV